MESWILLALGPVFFGFIAWEAWYWKDRRPVYSLKDTASNAALALMHQAADALAWLAVIGIYAWVYSIDCSICRCRSGVSRRCS